MKVVLSRKGCDSDFGGVPGIILPNDDIVYVPIPGDDWEEINYSDILMRGSEERLIDVMKTVTPKMRFYGEKRQLTEEFRCHFDPDLEHTAYPRADGWRGCFGQADAAQTVLRKANVSAGDLFLFFGWFNRTRVVNGKLCFCPGQGVHMIFGWLQIEQALYTSETPVPEWLAYHPHAIERRINRPSNCIYVGRKAASWNSRIKGYGIFPKASRNLILTKDGMSRSRWELPSEFKGIPLTYHSEKSWKDGYFQSACRGQEFVFEENDLVERWAKKLIEDNR